jgi:hypothetical protein
MIDMDAVPTALPDEPTTQVGHESAPHPIDAEVTSIWVKDWEVVQEIKGESTIRIQPPHSMETMKIVTQAIEAAPEAIEDPLEAPYLALCRLVHLAERYGWNDPGEVQQLVGPINSLRKPKTTWVPGPRASSQYDGSQVGPEIDVMRADPTGIGYPTAIRLTVSDWPEFKEWFLRRQAESFRDLWPLQNEVREFFHHFGETLNHHKPAADGKHITIEITNL